jgi:hypothetical protein
MVANKMMLNKPKTNKTELILITVVDIVFKLEQFDHKWQHIYFNYHVNK